MKNAALLVITSTIDVFDKSMRYAGIVDLTKLGVCSVMVELAYGVKPFQNVPGIVWVDSDSTMVTYDGDNKPVLTVHHYEEY